MELPEYIKQLIDKGLCYIDMDGRVCMCEALNESAACQPIQVTIVNNITNNYNAPINLTTSPSPVAPAASTDSTVEDKSSVKIDDFPAENHYADAARWVKKQKEEHRDYLREANQNIAELARRLTKIFGWVVDENQLRKAIRRI